MSIWTKDGLSHITPRGLDCPEGFDVHQQLAELAAGDKVFEIGCGRGRLAPAFHPDRYFGVDINVAALEVAAKAHPAHRFDVAAPADEHFDLTLLYTVALHLVDLPFEFRTPRVVIAEIMNPDLARPKGIPPAYNRAPEHYVDLMAERGYRLAKQFDRPYRYYPGENITFLEFEQC